MEEILESCPFCKSKDAPQIMAANHMLVKEINVNGFAVVCNHLKNGCGASGGYRETAKEAAICWNNWVGC